MKRALLRAAAIAAYAAYWGLWTFGYFDIHRTGVLTGMPQVLFGALVIGLPCFLVGAAIGRWWAPAVGLVFVAFLPLGDHCVTFSDPPDLFGAVCSGFSSDELPVDLVVTTPCVLAGVAAVKLLGRVRRPAPAV